MSVDVIFATDVLVDEDVFTLVTENDMNFLGARTANVRACKHENRYRKLGDILRTMNSTRLLPAYDTYQT